MFESIDEIRTFVRVVEAKSLTAVARELRVSANAVWRRLERIEERAGARLIERTTRTLRVTEAGERVAKHARRILESLDEAARAVVANSEQLRGTVRVAVSSDVAAGSFLLEVRELLDANPEFRVEVLGRSRLIEPVSAGVDIIVWAGPIATLSSTARKVGSLDWALAAAPSYVARRGAPTTPAELSAHDCLLAVRGQKETEWDLLGPDGTAISVPVSARFEADTSEILSSALAAGLGVGLRPLREVREAALEGRLVHILPSFRSAPMEISLVAPIGRLKSPHVRAVADALTRRLRELSSDG
jgi:DNA-binding transcriptional LysR family regulator